MTRFTQRNVGFRISRFTGVDGAALDRDAAAEIASTHGFTQGALGAAASHQLLWKQAAAGARPLLVFEDDATLRSDANSSLRQVIGSIRGAWDILLLGFNLEVPLAATVAGVFVDSRQFPSRPTEADIAVFRTTRSIVLPARLLSAFGLCGYAITPRGAHRLSNLCFPMTDRIVHLAGHPPMKVYGLDSMMCAFYSHLDAFVCFPPITVSPNIDSTTAE